MSRQILIMTYNIHSCIGMDGKASTQRIAEVIFLPRNMHTFYEEVLLGVTQMRMLSSLRVVVQETGHQREDKLAGASRLVRISPLIRKSLSSRKTSSNIAPTT